MFKKYNNLLLILCLTLILFSCHDDIGEINPETEVTTQITIPLNFVAIEGDLIGYVFDESNNPIEGANVSIYSGQTTTNKYGVFKFENKEMDPQGTFVKVEKSGYLIGSDRVYPNTNGKGTAKVKMLKVVNQPAFQASQGGVVEIEGGGTIAFPSSSLIRSNGSIYDGEVRSTAYRISPSNPDLGVNMPGGLYGLDNAGYHRVLSTYGVLAVELRGFDNQILRLKSDKVADLSLPIDSDLQSNVEDNVPAWSFNFEDGLWHEIKNTSNDKQNFYTSINSLGYWNIGIPYGLSQVCGRLVYNNELPAKNYEVQILVNGLPSRIGISDQDGFFCGKFPMGEDLKFQVIHPVCGGIIKELNLDPFENVGTIGDVVIDVEENYVSGTIECNGDLNENSTLIIESNGTSNVFYPDANGSFSINLEEIICSSSASYSIFAYNNDTELASEIEELDGNSSEALKLDVCLVECTAQVEFRYEKEDYCADGDFSRVFIDVVNGSGDYTYDWTNGSTNSFLENPVSGSEICVSIKDVVTGCNYSHCDDVVGYKRLGISSINSANTDCLLNSGFIDLEIVGGRGQVQYTWTGPNGFSSNEVQIKDLTPGTYSVTVRDDEGCEITETSLVYSVISPFLLTTEDFCDVTAISITDMEGYKPFTYNWSVPGETGTDLYVFTPGTYRVTITDANLCVRSSSVNITKAGTLPEINPTYTCEEGTITFSLLETGYDYYYQSFGSNDKIPVSMTTDQVNISVLEAGYRFELGSENPAYSDCNISETINLPQFEGLKIGSVINASCGSCNDGSIEIDIDNGANCQDCELGEVIVINRSSGADVTAANDLMQLENGEYYVIVLDVNNGCYVAHELVTLN